MARIRMAWMLKSDRGRDMVRARVCDGVGWASMGAVVSCRGVLLGVSSGGAGSNRGSAWLGASSEKLLDRHGEDIIYHPGSCSYISSRNAQAVADTACILGLSLGTVPCTSTSSRCRSSRHKIVPRPAARSRPPKTKLCNQVEVKRQRHLAQPASAR